MKICAISPFVSATSSEILQFLSSCSHDLIVLPGNGKNHPTCAQVSKVLKRGVFAFVETGAGKGRSVPWLVSLDQKIKMPSQVFAVKPTADDLDRLQSIWSARTHQVADREVSFAICGEIDAFSKNAIVKANRKLPYDILVNPTHTTRGRWNHLGVKLEALSAGTAVVHVANNDYDHHQVTTDVRIYVDGRIMERHCAKTYSWSECEI